MITNDITKRETIKAYINEAVVIKREMEVLKMRLKANNDSVKESEEALEISLADYKQAVEAAFQYAKQAEKVDKLQTGLDIVEVLGL